MATTSSLITAEELLALPDDGIDRELINGELREYPMTTRGAPHCTVMASLVGLLHAWFKQQPRPRGRLYVGDVRLRLKRNPDTFVGVDIAYIAADLAAQTAKDAKFIDGIPVLVIEILSPSDTVEEIGEKVEAYLTAGVSLVWEVNPKYEAVTVHRPGMPPELFNITQVLTAEPHLSGFRIPVAEVFEI
jgi:Uma2 family endonuclease